MEKFHRVKIAGLNRRYAVCVREALVALIDEISQNIPRNLVRGDVLRHDLVSEILKLVVLHFVDLKCAN